MKCEGKAGGRAAPLEQWQLCQRLIGQQDGVRAPFHRNSQHVPAHFEQRSQHQYTGTQQQPKPGAQRVLAAQCPHPKCGAEQRCVSGIADCLVGCVDCVLGERGQRAAAQQWMFGRRHED